MALLFSLHKNVGVPGVALSPAAKDVLGYYAQANLPLEDGKPRKRLVVRAETADVLGREVYISAKKKGQADGLEFKDTGETRRGAFNLSVILNERLTTDEFGNVLSCYRVAQQDAQKF